MIIGIDTSRAFGSEKTGTENYSYHLVTHLLQLPATKQHTFVLFTRPNVAIPEEIKQKNVLIRPVKLRYLWTQVGLAAATWQRAAVTQLHRDASRYLDVLWVPAHTLPVLRNPRVRTVVTIHGLEYRWLPEYHNLLQRWYLPLSTFYAARSADRLIAVSHFTRDQLLKELQTSTKKIKVIHEGVDASAQCHSVTVSLQKYGLQEKKYILFVGTVQPRKNLSSLIAAFAQIASDFPEYKLVIAGGIGWLAQEVLTAPRAHGIQERVVFCGRVSPSALQLLYQGAALYVQPSITEGFGLPVLEAMRAGVPVLVSDGGALPEVVGSAGIVVPLGPGFVGSLAEAMRTVLRDVKQQKRMVAMGSKRASKFSWRVAAEQTLRVLLG